MDRMCDDFDSNECDSVEDFLSNLDFIIGETTDRAKMDLFDGLCVLRGEWKGVAHATLIVNNSHVNVLLKLKPREHEEYIPQLVPIKWNQNIFNHDAVCNNENALFGPNCTQKCVLFTPKIDRQEPCSLVDVL